MELTCGIDTGQRVFFLFAQSGIEEFAHVLKRGVRPQQTPNGSLSYIIRLVKGKCAQYLVA
jgi:hypothetical protein